MEMFRGFEAAKSFDALKVVGGAHRQQRRVRHRQGAGALARGPFGRLQVRGLPGERQRPVRAEERMGPLPRHGRHGRRRGAADAQVARVLGHGAGGRARSPARIFRAGARARDHRMAAGEVDHPGGERDQALRRPVWPSTRSATCCRRTRSPASSARTAPARPRSSTCSPATTRPTRDRSATAARTSPASPPSSAWRAA